MTASITGSGGHKWSHDEVLLLIDTYRDNRHLLDSPAHKKVDVYQRLAAHLRSFGYDVSHEDCIQKMDNMLWRLLTQYDSRDANSKAN